MTRSIGIGRPKMWTGRSSRVRSVTAAAIRSASMFHVDSSMSTKTGVAPSNSAQLAEATNVNGEVIISSPGPRPRALTRRCKALVPELTATPRSRPM